MLLLRPNRSRRATPALLAGLDDKIGQLTEAERQAATPAQSTSARLGSILSGGGSTPTPNTPAGWADMVDAYHRAATSTGLGIPIGYGADTVHGHNNVHGATVFPHNIGLGASTASRLVPGRARR
jgi:beta-glucosidase